MEKLPVTITLRSRQVLDGEESRLEQQIAGTLLETEGGWQLRYRENTGAGGESCLTVEEGSALLERGGTMAARMRFQPGSVHPARYQTPYGALALMVETTYLGHTLSREGGRVLIRYQLSAQGQELGAYTLQLHVRAAGTPPEEEEK